MKVLVVDDDPAEVRRLQSIIEAYGHRVLTASTGAQSLTTTATEQPYWMILDTNLPDMSGLDVLRRLRLNPHTRDVGVLLANPDPKDEEVIFGFGYFSDAHWQRPIQAKNLRQLLDHQASLLGEPEEYRFDDSVWGGIWDAEAARGGDYSLEERLAAIRQQSNGSPPSTNK